MPCPATGPKMFWASPNILGQTKNLYIYILSQSQTFWATPEFPFSKFVFYAGTKGLEEALNPIKVFFVLVQNILGPVEGHVISFYLPKS